MSGSGAQDLEETNVRQGPDSVIGSSPWSGHSASGLVAWRPAQSSSTSAPRTRRRSASRWTIDVSKPWP